MSYDDKNWLDTLFLLYQSVQQDTQSLTFLHAPLKDLSKYAYTGEKSASCLFKEDYDAQNADAKIVSAHADLASESADLVMLRCVQNTDEMLGLIAEASRICKNGGQILLARPNLLGAKSIEKHLRSAFGNLHTISKNKCRGFTITVDKSNDNTQKLNDWAQQAAPQRTPKTGYVSQPGIFGWNKIDAGSQLLLNTLPDLQGRIADFGCGYGYLTMEACNKHQGITAIEAIDHDKRSIDALTENLASNEASDITGKVTPIWGDLSITYKADKPFDAIIMNPPFHAGKKMQIDLGISFIKNAYENLKKGGTLYMVANQTLPYEAPLNALFGTHIRVTDANGFKILTAQKEKR